MDLRTLHSALVAANDDGLQELITVLGATLCVAVLDGLDWVIALGSLSEDNALKSTVHGADQQKEPCGRGLGKVTHSSQRSQRLSRSMA